MDYKTVKVRAGKGGDGISSFLKLSENDKAGPDGGDGGNGGNTSFFQVFVALFIFTLFLRSRYIDRSVYLSYVFPIGLS